MRTERGCGMGEGKSDGGKSKCEIKQRNWRLGWKLFAKHVLTLTSLTFLAD